MVRAKQTDIMPFMNLGKWSVGADPEPVKDADMSSPEMTPT
jgi:hypothetical protein